MFRDLPHFGEGHRFVSFVFEIQRAPAMRMVAHAAVESRDGAVFVRANFASDRAGRDNLAGKLDAIVAMRSRHG